MSHLKQLLLIAVVLLATPLVARGQILDRLRTPLGSDVIETDRDSFTFATSTVGFGRSVLESSYSFIDNRRGPEAHSFPETVLRGGISDRVELRLGWNYEAGGATSAVSGVDFGNEDFFIQRSSEMLYGAKIATSKQSGWRPVSALLIEGYTPTSGPANFSRVVVGEAFGWTFSNKWQWSSAVRYGTANDQGDNFNQWAPSTVLNVPLGERLNIHAEYFGVMSAGKAAPQSQQYFSTGGHVHFSKDIELGLRVGFGLNAQTPAFFSNAGIGYRF